MLSSFFLRVVLLWVTLAQFSTATKLYLKIAGIEGESANPSYPGWIEAESLEFSGTVFQGSTGSFGIVKSADRSSPRLLKALERGRYLPRVTVAFLKEHPTDATGEDVEFARLLFRDIRVGRLRQVASPSTSVAGDILESFQLNYRAVFYRYTPDNSAPVTTYADLDQGVDSDSDGMTDNYEDFFGLNKNIDDGGLDSDGDGLTHLEEFRLGLNPRLGSSAFVPKGDADPEDPQKFRLTWATKPAKVYDIYLTPDLMQEPVFLRRVTASELDTSSSFTRIQSRGFFSIREVME